MKKKFCLIVLMLVKRFFPQLWTEVCIYIFNTFFELFFSFQSLNLLRISSNAHKVKTILTCSNIYMQFHSYLVKSPLASFTLTLDTHQCIFPVFK